MGKAKNGTVGTQIIQKQYQAYLNILENGKFERLNAFKSLSAKFQNDQISVFEAVEHIRMPDS